MMAFLRDYLLALCGGAYLFSFGMRQSRHRWFLRVLLRHLGWRRETAAPVEEAGWLGARIPAVGLAEIVDHDLPVKMLCPDMAGGNVTLHELLAINHLVNKHQPRRMFEIGTFNGRTALNMAANAPAGAEVVTLDLPRAGLDSAALRLEDGDVPFVDKPASGTCFAATCYAGQIRQVYGDSATFDISPYAGKMDLVFVDGSHSYEYVKADSQTALRLLKSSGGVILWHDYGSSCWPGVAKALGELLDAPEGKRLSLRHIAGTSLVVGEMRRKAEG